MRDSDGGGSRAMKSKALRRSLCRLDGHLCGHPPAADRGLRLHQPGPAASRWRTSPRMAQYTGVFGRSFLLAIIATADLPAHRLSPGLLCWPRRGLRCRRVAMMLIMLPMWMNFLLRTYSWMFLLEKQRLDQQLLLGLFGHRPKLPHDQHPGGHRAGHGLQLPALHDPAHLLRH